MRHALAALTLALVACKVSDLQVRIDLDGVAPPALTRVRTTITPMAPRRFDVDLPPTPLRTGEQYQVGCVDCPADGCAADCVRVLIFEEDATLGFPIVSPIELRLRAEQDGAIGPLDLRATGAGADGATLASSDHVEVDFDGPATVDLFVRPPGRCGQVTCADDEQCCDLVCVSRNDPAHCGACGTQCGDAELCSQGACQCAGAPACASGQGCCQGVGCVDPTSDPKHCGGCDVACAAGEDCVAGACRCAGGDACAAGQHCCGAGAGCLPEGSNCPCGAVTCAGAEVCCAPAQCATLAEDTDCGACGRQCSSGNHCVDGACLCGAVTCPSPSACCGDRCVDLAADPKNCGGCGLACSAGEICSGGACHCGTVDATACAGGDHCCGGACVPDGVANCGACDALCDQGETCSGGACHCGGAGLPGCGAGKLCCAGACVDPATDHQNCHTCGNACNALSACQGGVCVQTTCDPSCVGQGNACTGTTCSCGGGSACPAPSFRCCATSTSKACAHTDDDPANCGACGTKCKAGEICSAGVCKCGGAVCGAQQACCGGVCKSVLTDPLNCNGCGLTCARGETCQGGYCYCGPYKTVTPGTRGCPYGEFCYPPTATCQYYGPSFCPFNQLYLDCTGTGGVCCGECADPNASHCGSAAACPMPGQPNDCKAF